MALLDFNTSFFCYSLCPPGWSPWKEPPMQKGVRQGDPISPLLFVLAVDLLQCIVNKVHAQGLL
jgi:hypothetical protein